MKFLKGNRIFPLARILFIFSIVACEEDLTTIGAGVIGNDPFTTDKAVFDVFATNKNITSFQANKLPIYQLGVYEDPIYGRTEARITSQVTLQGRVGNPTFGIFSQDAENNGQTGNGQVAIQENEEVIEVFLHIPYLTRAITFRDQDSDGVDDVFDVDPADPNSDSDGDGISDNAERQAGTNPLNEDTDGDGINDAVDDETVANIFPRQVDLDSIFGNREEPFNFKVERSSFFLRDLDPATNFMEAQEYFSSQQFSPTFVEEVLFDGMVTVSNEQTLIFKEDDNTTEDDESLEAPEVIEPGIRVKLGNAFFQQNILDKEGDIELLSVANFNEFIRGVHLSITPTAGEDLLALFDITRATIRINYNHDRQDEDAGLVKTAKTYTLSLIQDGGNGFRIGNAVNTFVNDPYPSQIADNLDTEGNTQRIYLKGGAGIFSEIKLFDEVNGQEIINQIKANNWIINEANLVFYVDRNALSNAGGVIEPQRLFLYNAENNFPLYNIANDPLDPANPINSLPNYDGRLETSDNLGLKYTIRITDHINNIIVRDSTNATLGLSITSNINDPTTRQAMLANGEDTISLLSTINPLGTILFGSNVSAENENKKLQLEIFYTETN